ncbi:MAG: pirin family protein [Hyphomicrobiales bacterium]|nr:pirin family protein [Hyphomicrobiales bacterium]MDE2113669.1 pirin family protein [Hyphomicrobiales bacterium]
MTLRTISLHFPAERQTSPGGFSVHRFNDDDDARFMDPYLMVDAYTLSEAFFSPHPHAGFAPVSYIYPESEIGLINRDSAGTFNRVAPGDMHWMTSGRGIVHEEVPEMTGRDARGLQIFVNLPRAQKFMDPGYVFLGAADVPTWKGEGTIIRAVLGQSNGLTSPARVPYPVRLIDIELQPGATFEQELTATENAFIYIFEGDARFEDGQGITELDTFEVVATHKGGTRLRLTGGRQTARIVLFAGEPINEPVVAYGPFVMNSMDDIRKVMEDYRRGRMGRVEPTVFGADHRPLQLPTS